MKTISEKIDEFASIVERLSQGLTVTLVHSKKVKIIILSQMGNKYFVNDDKVSNNVFFTCLENALKDKNVSII